MISVGSEIAKKGSRVISKLEVGELANGSKIFIPVIIINGRNEGPVLWLNGAVHGDELNGVLAMRELAMELKSEQLRGTLICTPISNPLAFQNRSKLSLLDNLDLDQQFPGNEEGFISQRIAFVLFKEIKNRANYLINFHTLGSYYLGKPYTVFKVVPGARNEIIERSKEMAKIFGVYLNCKVDISKAKNELPGSLAGALDVNCILNNIPAFMAEMGSGGRFENDNIKIAINGIKNIMKYLDMISGKTDIIEQQVILTRRKFIKCNYGGLAIMHVQPYYFLKKGERIAQIIDLYGDTKEEILTTEDVYVIGTRFNPVVNTGDRIVFVGSSSTNKSSSLT